MNKRKCICTETSGHYVCENGELLTADEVHDRYVELVMENRGLKLRIDELLAARTEIEQLKKDNRRMLIIIAAMEKLLDVELTELI